MTAHANQMSKSRRWGQGEPYLRFEADGWTWDVLKSWQGDNGKEYARWFCEVSSPFTGGSADLGDTYVDEVVRHGVLTYADPSVDLDVLRQQVQIEVSPSLTRSLS